MPRISAIGKVPAIRTTSGVANYDKDLLHACVFLRKQSADKENIPPLHCL